MPVQKLANQQLANQVRKAFILQKEVIHDARKMQAVLEKIANNLGNEIGNLLNIQQDYKNTKNQMNAISHNNKGPKSR